ncbi:MAG: 5-formyltetrahydrofolate cyclo-ligase [Pseudomonadota bacterium]
MTTPDLSHQKSELRKVAAATRKRAFAKGGVAEATWALVELLDGHPPGVISGYWPIRTELDPRPALHLLYRAGWQVCLPVVLGSGQPLAFRAWAPGDALVEGAYKAMIPAKEEACTPNVVLAPLLAFDDQGYRLGYGGGFYDRTLDLLRRSGPVQAYGYALSAQQVPQVPREATDQPLDGIVTELGVVRPAR